MELETLKDLYVEELKDLYSAEQQILKALPKMVKASNSPELKRAFEKHLRQTEGHVKRLDRIFAELDQSPKGKKCVGMEGVIKEGKELIGEKPEAEVLDAGLIAAAQHVEHYEIAGYGTARTYATTLGMSRQAQLLEETLREEKETDVALTQLAESGINVQAERGGRESASSVARTSRSARKGNGRGRTGGRRTESNAMAASSGRNRDTEEEEFREEADLR